MKYRKLSSDTFEVSAIAFGAWAIGGWMWGGADEEEAIKAIHAAVDVGITTIDTAPVYGFGKSEELVGKAIKGKRDKLQILTKYGLRWDSKDGEFFFNSQANDGSPIDIYRYAGKESVIAECEDSLRLLGTDYIDLYQIHWPDPTTPVSETMEAIELLLQQGKIRAAGVCNYSAELMKEANSSLKLATNQVPYSMVERGIEKDVVPYCLENDMTILPYSPLQRGILTGKIKPGHKFNDGDHRPGTPHYQEPNLSRINAFLDDIRPIAEAHDATLAQLVLHWTMMQPAISCVLAGARNATQVLDNVKAAELMLSDEELGQISDKLDGLKLEL